MRIDNKNYDELLEHSNQYLNKHNIFKEGGKLFTYVKYGPYRKLKQEIIKPSQRANILKELYNDPATRKNGRDSFYVKVREKYINIPRAYIFEWLQKQENYQLHLIQPREKILRPISEKKINAKWQIDLIDMSNHGGPNNRNKYWILTVIDVFSKYAWARAMPNKEGDTTRKYFEEILNDGHEITSNYPKIVQSDNGKEFLNKDMEFLFEFFEIKHILSPPYMPQANGCIERFNRTLKQMIYSGFTKNNNTKWVDYLQIYLKNYNNSVHTTIKDKPVNIHRPDRANVKQQKLIGAIKENWLQTSRIYKPLKIGDKVRVHILTNKEERKNKIFAKKYVPQWSKEIYTINSIKEGAKSKPTYKLTNQNNILTGNFYRHDLQKI